MMTARVERLSWVLDPPRETVEAFRSASPGRPAILTVVLSALFSAALADVTIAPSTLRDLILSFLSYLTAFLLFTLFLHQLSRVLTGATPPARAWLEAGAVAMMPAHLVLPAALILKPFGTTGLLIFELAKLWILASVLRRWIWAVQGLNAWPPWAAALLVAGPLAIAVAALLLLALLMFLAVLMAVAGAFQ